MAHKDGLTIVIPTYNEAANIRPLANRVSAVMETAGIAYELIFVDDHSKDATRSRVRALPKHMHATLRIKEGKPGKGYSILEGAKHASYAHIAMLDADLQYPPEILPELYAKARKTGIGVARRKTYKSTLLRTVGSRLNAFVFGKLLLNIPTDIQSGCKIFARDVFEHVETKLVTAWAVDIPLLYTAYELGYTVSHVDIDFRPRENGQSNVHILTTAWQIARGALRTRGSNRFHPIQPENASAMTGSGYLYKRKRYVTHTTLSHTLSALESLTIYQKLAITTALALLIVGLIYHAYTTAIIFTATISFVYFTDVLFNLFIIMKSLSHPPDIKVSEDELKRLKDRDLPMYSILCPLYREAAVLPQFMAAMEELDWPKEKLDILLLLEENDKETIDAAKAMHLPHHVSIVVVPDSQPKTKPKACNFGLSLAQGEYVVIFDAEDKPDPLQLKKSYLAFKHAPANVACMQAKLNYYNPHHNILTRLFTAEYSLWFDVVLPGLQSIQTTIPLGGTSNHFRTEKLLELKGWDPFNVTEDADLGARLFRNGYKTAIIDSVTLEEANSDVKNWFRQRSRWIKGYIQTYFVHFRNPFRFARQYGRHALLFQLIVGGKIAFMLINPILWLVTFSYFALYRLVGPTIEAVYPAPVFYMAAFSLVFGNFIYLYNYMIGVAKRGQWDLVKYVFLVPIYWLMISIGAAIAVVQFFVKPYYWEKTIHGLHLGQHNGKNDTRNMMSVRARIHVLQNITDLIHVRFVGNFALIGSNFAANIFNFLYSAYLARTLSLEEFGLVGLVGSFWYVAQVPIGSLSGAVAHRSAFLLGQYSAPVQSFWRMVRKNAMVAAIGVTILWLFSIPKMMTFFQSNTAIPFLLFTPAWLIGTLAAVDSGYLNGNLKFISLAASIALEPLVKLLLAIIFVQSNAQTYVYASIPASMLAGLTVVYLFARTVGKTKEASTRPSETHVFPWKYYTSTVVTNITNIMFLGIDVALAKHYLTPTEAGQYSVLSLAGKMIYFLGSLTSSFLVPYVSRELGADRSTQKVFRTLLRLGILANIGAYLIFGVFGFITVPILWGNKSADIIHLLPVYGMAMVTYGVATLIITYNQLHGRYAFPIVGFILAALQIIGTAIFHESVDTIASIVAISGILSLATMIALHKYYLEAVIVWQNILDFWGLFFAFPHRPKIQHDKHHILIFNWRDTKHVWSGGAEVYIHELGKRWVCDGHHVTIFCGNDGKNPRYETLDGIRIIRRGGFYMVYLWAFLYYMKHFRGKYDVIIDSENGLPFFTPLYAREKVYLLIHHVHQDIFRKTLIPPFSWIAQLLERRVMPIVYRNTEVITVSPSSKADILRHKLTRKDPHIIYNGVDLNTYVPGKKSAKPMVLYLGRLTTAKSLNVLIRATEELKKKIPRVQVVIAGHGPELNNLKKLVEKLKLSKTITFTGKVSEEEKVSLMQKAWVFVNPSLMEGWGITTIEANACGTPVVASNVAGLRDAVHNPHSGELVPYGNVEDFTSTIARLLTSTARRQRMSREAIVWAKRFDWEKSARDAIKIL